MGIGEDAGRTGWTLPYSGLVRDWSSFHIALPVALALAVGLGSQLLSEERLERMQGSFAKLHPSLQGAALALCLFTVDLLGPEGVAAFIYFQF